LPLYHFNVESQGADEDSVELDDIKIALCVAVTTAGAMICGNAAGFWGQASASLRMLSFTDDVSSGSKVVECGR
jgi:hypothetical protein